MKVELQEVNIRPLQEQDNAAIASVIRTTLEEFGANHPGTVYYDDSTDALFTVFNNKSGAVYYVAEAEGKVVGGGGVYPSNGLPTDTCELVKMYLLPMARGIGLGKKLIQRCIDFAKAAGYKNIYLETMPELKLALKTYEKFGFEYINHSMGNTGHFGCELWMLKSVD